jgi:hypothetical protein
MGVTLRHCTFDEAAQPNITENVRDLVLDNVRINGQVVK